MTKLCCLSLVLFTACTSSSDSDDFSPFDQQAHPNPDGKSDDARACGDDACAPRECGYDCTTAGEQCTQACAAAPGRADAFVAATVEGSTIDSRNTPFDEVFSLDNVLVYGCELWDFSNQAKDGLEIQLQELRHSSFTVNPNDPTTFDRKLDVYVAPFTGPGSYSGDGLFQANQDAPRYFGSDACSVDVTATETGGLHGTFECRLASNGSSGGAIEMRGEFGCPVDAMSPIFSRWTPSN